MLVRRIHLAVPVFALVAGATPAMAQSVQVITPAPVPVQSAGHHRPQRAAAAAGRDHPAAAGTGGPWMYLAARATGCGTARAGAGPRVSTSSGRPRRRSGSPVIGCSSRPAATSGSTAAGQADDDACTPRCLALPALACSPAACGSETAAAHVPDHCPAPAQPVATAAIAPGPPPPPQSELVPTPPVGAGPVVWQPGHWLLSGNNWVWQPGQYVPPPPGQTTWVPGRWLQQPTGGWMWLEGHWA